MKGGTLIVVAAVALFTAGEAAACRIYRSPLLTYQSWFDESEILVRARVVNIGQTQEDSSFGGVWSRPFIEVDRIVALRGSSPDKITIRGEEIVNQCRPTLTSGMENLAIDDEVLVMLDAHHVPIGLLKSNSDVAERYINQLMTPEK